VYSVHAVAPRAIEEHDMHLVDDYPTKNALARLPSNERLELGRGDVLGGKHEEWYRCLEPGLIIDRVDTSTVSVDKGLCGYLEYLARHCELSEEDAVGFPVLI
jgi:hypothetical protein